MFVPVAVNQTYGFFTRGSVIGGESCVLRRSSIKWPFSLPRRCSATSSQKSPCDGFLYSSRQPVEDDHGLREGLDNGAQSPLAP